MSSNNSRRRLTMPKVQDRESRLPLGRVFRATKLLLRDLGNYRDVHRAAGILYALFRRQCPRQSKECTKPPPSNLSNTRRHTSHMAYLRRCPWLRRVDHVEVADGVIPFTVAQCGFPIYILQPQFHSIHPRRFPLCSLLLTMSSLHETNASQKPIDSMHPDNLPEDSKHPEVAAGALEALVEQSTKHDDVKHTIHAPMHLLAENHFVRKLIPGLQNIASEYHVGNYVQMRGSSEKFFESMPLYPRYVNSCPWK
jgi:hypothetical protein